VKIGGISRKTVAIYGAINFGAINLLLQKMEQFYGAIIWYHLMAPFYGMCVPGFRTTTLWMTICCTNSQMNINRFWCQHTNAVCLLLFLFYSYLAK